MKGQQRDWNELAELDPFWAVLSDPNQQYGRWDEEAFFVAGEREIKHVLGKLSEAGVEVRTGVALDFGCGLGRLSRALSRSFNEVVGVDISPEMVRRAGMLNEGRPIRFLVNATSKLPFENGSFDFVYTSNVLQHLPSRENVIEYLREFTRVLKKEGVLAVQAPFRVPLRNRLQPRRHLYHLLRSLGFSSATLYARGLNPIRMIAVTEQEVSAALRPARVLFSERGVGEALNSMTYFAQL
jgi:SAM-dependent methyltransferase